MSGGTKRFRYLPVVALAALSLPHSNADPERCFSMVRKIQTDQRDRLSNKTINSLLSIKLNSDEDCHMFNVNEKLMKAAKSACVNYNETIKKAKHDCESNSKLSC